MNNKFFNIIISPAKKMYINNDDILSESMPRFMEKTETIYNTLKNYSYDDLKKLCEEAHKRGILINAFPILDI